MNFVQIQWLDVFELTASLRVRAGLFVPTEAVPGQRLLPIRGYRKDTEPEIEDFVGYAVATKWPELTTVRSRVKRLGDALLGEMEFGRIWLEMLDPGAVLPWQTEGDRWQCAHLPLRTNPATMMYAGIEALSPAQGWLTIVNTRVPHSAVNLGETPRVHLVCQFRKKATQE